MKLFLFFCFAVFVFASDALTFGDEKKDIKTTIYSVQLFSEKDIAKAKTILEKTPENIKKETFLHKIGDYVVGRYGENKSYSSMKQSLQKAKEAGYLDAYIIESTNLDMKNSLVFASTQEEKKQHAKVESSTIGMSKFDQSNILLKANNAYQSGSEAEAMLYYEMLLASGYENQKMKNNLCYLYGKQGAWFQAKNIIEGQRYQGKLLYAYANGAVQSNQENYYNDILPYIAIDNSGKLMMLTGFYFEKREDMQRAISFYKMAYEKNPSDPYNIFAYARVLDMEQKTQATALYRDVLSKINSSHPLYATIQKRVSELGE
jgi:tetratricopeptide (TPR) repeat protein